MLQPLVTCKFHQMIICCWTQFLLQWSPGLHSEVQLSSYRCSVSEWWFMGFRLWTSDTSARSVLPVGRVRLLFNPPTLIFYLFLVSLSQLLSRLPVTHMKTLSHRNPLGHSDSLAICHSLTLSQRCWSHGRVCVFKSTAKRSAAVSRSYFRDNDLKAGIM